MSIKNIEFEKKIINECSKVAKKSTCNKAQHAAAIVDMNGVIKAIAPNTFVEHAEVAVIKKQLYQNKSKIKKNDILVVCRHNITSESAPCVNCIKYIIENTKIKNIIYSTNDIDKDNIICTRINRLKQHQTHLSSKDKKKLSK